MSWRDRDYNQSGYGGGRFSSPLFAILYGSAPLGTWFGIRVRVHASLIVLIVLTLLFDFTQGYDLRNRAISMTLLFVIVLLHEFGHCFAARSVGGSAEDILMWPLGGLAFANAPHRPWPTFVTVGGGPLVNVIICLITGGILWFLTGGWISWNPFHLIPSLAYSPGSDLGWWSFLLVWWSFKISYGLLLFNLLPIFPLDGGQLLQSILWPHMGYYRSMLFSCGTGMIGAVGMGFYSFVNGGLFLLFLSIWLFLHCYQRRRLLKEAGPEAVEETDYSASLRDPPGEQRRRRRLSRRVIQRARRRAAREQAEQARIDTILDKVSAQGMHSLSWWERRALRKATERQRQRDLERAGKDM